MDISAAEFIDSLVCIDAAGEREEGDRPAAVLLVTEAVPDAPRVLFANADAARIAVPAGGALAAPPAAPPVVEVLGAGELGQLRNAETTLHLVEAAHHGAPPLNAQRHHCQSPSGRQPEPCLSAERSTRRTHARAFTRSA